MYLFRIRGLQRFTLKSVFCNSLSAFILLYKLWILASEEDVGWFWLRRVRVRLAGSYVRGARAVERHSAAARDELAIMTGVILTLFIVLVNVTSWSWCVCFEVKLHFNHNLRLRKQKSSEYRSVTDYWSSCRPSRMMRVASRSDWKSRSWSIPIKCWCSVRASVLTASRWVKISPHKLTS